MELWLKRRMPPQKQQTLTQKSIFIFPGLFGLAYLFVALFLYILGTNYQNNLILLMSFTLVSFFISSILFSYSNLSGLTVSAGQPQAVYAGQVCDVPIKLSNSVSRNSLRFMFRGHKPTVVTLAEDPEKVMVPYQVTRRGRIDPGRVTLKSYFPLGLFRCWTHLDLDISILAYPKPIEAHVPLVPVTQLDDQSRKAPDQADDFAGIRDHIPGESLSRVSWKHVARTQDKLISKQFEESDQAPMWLSLHQVKGEDIELRLSKLTWAVNQYSHRNCLFGLELGQTRIAPGMGEAHRIQCLEALALW